MADLGKEFDANEAPSSNGNFDVIPAGTKAVAVLDKSEYKDTTSGDGKRLACEFLIVEGEHEGRRVFEGFNLVNKNPKAEVIANAQFADLCKATGVIKLSDSSELHGIPVIIKIGVQAANGQYEAKNTVKGFAAVESVKAIPAGEIAKAAPAPWARKSA